MEEQTDIVELIDEDNNIIQFEYFMSFDYGDNDYIVLTPLEEQSEQDDEIVILRVEQDDNGEDVYVTIDDEEELDQVFDAVNQIINSDM